MSFVRDVVDAAPPSRLAMVAIGRDGERREIGFGEVADRSARFAGALAACGVRRGDSVMTVVGNRAEWVYAMLACWRLGAVALPCTEQLRPADLRARMEKLDPRAVVADARDLALVEATGFDGAVLPVPDESLFSHEPAPAADVSAGDPALVVFTSGTAGEPKAIRHGHGYLSGQRVQAEHWYDARPGDLCWCTAASGWSLSARNAFLAAWLRGAAALLHDARFDAAERLDVLERERVNVLCMSPTEYRAIAKRAALRPLPALRHACAAGEPLNPEVVRAWGEATGVQVHDGYGQTETGHLAGMPIGPPVRPGSMGRPLPGIRLDVDGGELVVDPASVPTFFAGYLGEPAPAGPPVRPKPPRHGLLGYQDLRVHLYLWLVLSAFLLVIWAGTGFSGVWPIFPIAGTGLPLAVHAVVRAATSPDAHEGPPPHR
jgi:acyl-coenzyme A synthetase/AMP-(fatty) acid ligase